jgi:hypothetical protein
MGNDYQELSDKIMALYNGLGNVFCIHMSLFSKILSAIVLKIIMTLQFAYLSLISSNKRRIEMKSVN